jgi:hypothetical protein
VRSRRRRRIPEASRVRRLARYIRSTAVHASRRSVIVCHSRSSIA